MLDIFKLIRPTNLLVIIVTQVLIFYFIIIPPLLKNDITPVLTGTIIPLFISVTVILAAGANVINDLKDQAIDLINKPEKAFISDNNRKLITILYWMLMILGAAVSIYISVSIERISLLAIYPVTAILLYYYSSHLKSTPLIGNIIVSLFCALVIIIIWYAELSSLNTLKHLRYKDFERTTFLLSGLTIFSFMSNFTRELIKDIEDVDGDRKGGIHTFAVIYGIDKAKVLALFNLMILWIISVAWLGIGLQKYFNILQVLLSGLLILIIPIYLWKIIKEAKTPRSFSRISILLKWYMLLGLVAILILT